MTRNRCADCKRFIPDHGQHDCPHEPEPLIKVTTASGVGFAEKVERRRSV